MMLNRTIGAFAHLLQLGRIKCYEFFLKILKMNWYFFLEVCTYFMNPYEHFMK